MCPVKAGRASSVMAHLRQPEYQISVDQRYAIVHRKPQRANRVKRICPHQGAISQQFLGPDWAGGTQKKVYEALTPFNNQSFRAGSSGLAFLFVRVVFIGKWFHMYQGLEIVVKSLFDECKFF